MKTLSTSNAFTPKTIVKEATTMNAITTTAIANVPETTAKEATTMNIPMMIKAINFGITTADITKFFSIGSEEIAPTLDAYYTKHKVYGKRALAQLNANDRAAEASESRKRASYSDDLTETILYLIKHGANMEDLSRCFNIKQEKTVKKWLLEKWPKVGKRHFELLLENGNPNSVKVPEPTEEEVTFESWYGSKPEVDCIISRYMDPTLTELAKDYCEQNGLSYILAKSSSYITAQSLALGRVTIISDSEDLKPICEEDEIPFLMATDLFKKIVTFENTDIQFTSKQNFKSFSKSKTGVYSCVKSDLIAELKCQYSPTGSYSVFLSKKDTCYKEAPERFGIKDGQSFIVIVAENYMVSAWKFQLSAGHFHEVNYASGPKSMLIHIMRKLA